MTESSPPPKSAADERADRLAAALRANLRRRKDQARGRDAGDPTPAPRDGGGDAAEGR